MTPECGLFLGIDGGGTSTRAVLADRSGIVLGRGEAGPGNPKSNGLELALEEVRRAIEGAFAAAHLTIQEVDAICLALAGAGRPEDRPPIQEWVHREQIAARSAVVADALAVLGGGSPSIVGVSLIAGTGSMAFARNESGSETRAGGWGSLFGDEGSGYSLAIAGLRAAAKAADGRGPSTRLLPAFLDRLRIQNAGGLVTTLFSHGWDKRRIASLATIVTSCSESGDDIAGGLVQNAVGELKIAVVAVAQQLEWKSPPLVAMTGGLVLNSSSFRQLLERDLKFSGPISETVVVAEPALGSVAIARRLAEGEKW